MLRAELRARPLDDFEPVHDGHVEIHNREIEGLPLHRLDGDEPILRLMNATDMVFERCRDQKASGGIIVDHEHGRFGSGSIHRSDRDGCHSILHARLQQLCAVSP